RTFADEVEEKEDTRRRPQYFLVRKRTQVNIRKGTDFRAIRSNWISITPLDANLNAMPKSTIPAEVCQALFQELKERLFSSYPFVPPNHNPTTPLSPLL
ncbi:MAG: hypothetical protein HW403_1374, partial [Dehalococcoidia bacterium]|nr:hypothetical protein [Dehalococcoidia bacterium]